jgi:HNH endonuclease
MRRSDSGNQRFRGSHTGAPHTLLSAGRGIGHDLSMPWYMKTRGRVFGVFGRGFHFGPAWIIIVCVIGSSCLEGQMKKTLEFLSLTNFDKPLASGDGHRILERDHYFCQYCGLDGMTNFENSLTMTVDFGHPRARKGKKTPNNLVAACRPCNVIKGHRVFDSFAMRPRLMFWSAGRSCTRTGT